jgi:hypothetical protein
MKLQRFVAMACLVASAQAFANGTPSTGTIWRMDAVGSAGSAPGNADTRVYLNGVSTFCPGSPDPSWAFINANDANYKGVLATLMMAYATGKSVTIYAVPAQIGTTTFCQISWINVIG